jgi:hypothetical protein
MRHSLLVFFLLLQCVLFGQAPQGFKYQSIARDLSGNELVNLSLGIRITLHDASPTGTAIYQEEHNANTNDFGLFNLTIGGGNPVVGQFNLIDWANGSKYIQLEVDIAGGSNYTSFGTTELLSVPYALYANTAGLQLLPNGSAVGNTPYWDGSAWVISSSNIHNDGGNIGIGTTTPLRKLHVNGHINIPKDSTYRINDIGIVSIKGNNNLFLGQQAGSLNSLGFVNVFVGYNAGQFNQVGGQNTFVGAETGVQNLDGSMNSFLGRRAGFLNTSGSENTFLGAYAGQSNTEGIHNSFLGVTTGNSNTLGSENTFLGAHAGYNNNLGNNNSFIGNFAGLANTTGSDNTLLGYYSNVGAGGLTNATAIGNGAIVNASNSVIIGNTAVTSIGGQVGWSTYSDKRLKTNITKSELGLDFILSLQPVTYNYKAQGQSNLLYTGLIAQDVEKLLKQLDTEFSGLVKPQNDGDYYSIRYAEFVLPLINAVQEQQQTIDELKIENAVMQERLLKLEQQFEILKKNK